MSRVGNVNMSNDDQGIGLLSAGAGDQGDRMEYSDRLIAGGRLSERLAPNGPLR